jgi:hypothetical protein
VEQQWMHQDDIAGLCRILQDLERDAVDLFDSRVEPLDARSRIAGGSEIAQVRMAIPSGPA